jgi:hypothetical protein
MCLKNLCRYYYFEGDLGKVCLFFKEHKLYYVFRSEASLPYLTQYCEDLGCYCMFCSCCCWGSPWLSGTDEVTHVAVLRGSGHVGKDLPTDFNTCLFRASALSAFDVSLCFGQH